MLLILTEAPLHALGLGDAWLRNADYHSHD